MQVGTREHPENTELSQVRSRDRMRRDPRNGKRTTVDAGVLSEQR